MSNIDSTLRSKYQKSLFEQVIERVKENKIKKIGLYWGFEPEVETEFLIADLLQLGVEVYLPRILKNRQMVFKRYRSDNDLEIIQGKIVQPNGEAISIEGDSLEWLIVPGVAFMESGHRIGFGGGYYDRYLAKLDKKIKTSSLIFPCQLFESGQWETENHDVAVDELIMVEEELDNGL